MKRILHTLLFAAVATVCSLTSAQAQDPKAANPWAVTLGATSAQATFSTYMAIAELADLAGAKTYDKNKCIEFAGMYAKLTENAKESLTDLLDSGKVNKDDEEALRQIVVINDLLGKTAQGIITYLKDSSVENEAAYQKARQKSWKALSKFLGIEE